MSGRHIDFVLNRVRMLLFFGVTPYLVFDGDNLPSKSGTESDRLHKREESKKLALELHNKGRTAEAQQEFQKAVDVTPYMARQLIEELKRMKVQYVVAPYEADSQLVYLERQGIINGIISEDSDLLVFGAKRLLSKLDQHGDCIEINRSEFSACRDISLIGWTDADFRRMCILSGCDYLPNIPKMGLKTAYRNMRKYKNVEKILKVLQFEGHSRIPTGYLEKFQQAENTFLYQRVFCPALQKLVTLTTAEPGLKVEEMPYIGADVEPEIAIGVACGDLDPMTKDHINLKPYPAPRAVPNLIRRQTLASSADLKSNKPINSFFTPKRVPLAELDPNDLTPSPSQQRLLERHANSSWQPSTAPANSGLMRSMSSTSLRRSGESPATRTVERGSFLARAARIATVPAVKRQRLCSDADEETLPSPLGEARSRFFETSNINIQNSSRPRKSRRSTFGVFSDDVAEDIMCQLAETPGPANVSKKAPEKDGKIESAPDAETTVAESVAQPEPKAGETAESCRTKEKDTTNDQDSVDSSPRPVSIDTEPELFNKVLEAHVKNQNSSLLSTFAFSGSSKSPNPARKFEEEPSLMTRTATSGTEIEPRLIRSNSLRRRLTPLQRLGQSALSKSKSMDHFSIRKMLNSTTRDSGYESDFGRDSQDSQRDAVPKVNNNFGGSEDQIIPCSDEETDESPNEGERPTLNLGRFSFVP
jgi:exonuclease-1